MTSPSAAKSAFRTEFHCRGVTPFRASRRISVWAIALPGMVWNRTPSGGRHEATMSVMHGRPVRALTSTRLAAAWGKRPDRHRARRHPAGRPGRPLARRGGWWSSSSCPSKAWEFPPTCIEHARSGVRPACRRTGPAWRWRVHGPTSEDESAPGNFATFRHDLKAGQGSRRCTGAFTCVRAGRLMGSTPAIPVADSPLRSLMERRRVVSRLGVERGAATSPFLSLPRRTAAFTALVAPPVSGRSGKDLRGPPPMSCYTATSTPTESAISRCAVLGPPSLGTPLLPLWHRQPQAAE